MKKMLFLVLVLANTVIYAQSKKQQIIILKNTVDSFRLALSNEINLSKKNRITLNSRVDSFRLALSSEKESKLMGEKRDSLKIYSLERQYKELKTVNDNLSHENSALQEKYDELLLKLETAQENLSVASDTISKMRKKIKMEKTRSEEARVNQTNNLETNKTLLPQSIDYDGMPALEYTINNEIIALDFYDENHSEGSYIRMKLKDKEVILKMQKQYSSKARRIYSNSDYVVTFDEITYGKCAGEGAQYLTGKLLIQTSSDQNSITFKGSDALYSSKECQEMGNG